MQPTRHEDHRSGGAATPRIAIVVSRYNRSITSALLQGALAEYERAGAPRSAAAVFLAPGSFELPVLALAAAETGRFDAVVALGCLIKGETRHDRYIAEAVSQSLAEIAVKTGIPVSFGVITADTPRQARARAGGKRGNKGTEAMAAALEAIPALAAIRAGSILWPANTTLELKPAKDKAARSEPRKAKGKPKAKRSASRAAAPQAAGHAA
jgi:6,7-dimethyl-8-ribityllumazine synthase